MIRRLLPLLLVACTPAAQTVGAWTTAVDTGATAPGSSGAASDDGTVADGTSSSGADVESGSAAATGSDDADASSSGAAAAPPWVATVTATPDGAPMLQILALVADDAIEVHDGCTFAGLAVADGLGWRADGRLVGTDAATGTLWQADPCDCTVGVVDGIEPPPLLHALTERGDGSDGRVFGVDDGRAAIVELDLDLALTLAAFDRPDAAVVLALASDDDTLVALLERAGPVLQRIDPDDGAVLQEQALTLPPDTRGLTRDPAGDGFVACSDDGSLWRIAADGATTAIGEPLASACRTLATPHGPVACIDAALGG